MTSLDVEAIEHELERRWNSIQEQTVPLERLRAEQALLTRVLRNLRELHAALKNLGLIA